MKRCLFLLVASCLLFAAQAQRVYFMYLQSENATPFFVKMGDKVYSSTATGYLILSNLKDSTYTFSVGFPGGKIAEKRFGVQIKEGDRGFLLKNFEEGLGLFDLQSLGVVKAIAAAGVPDNVQVIAKNDPFTRLLAEAADDASLLTTTVALKTEAPRKEVKKEPEPPVKTDVVVEQKVEPKSDIVAVVDSNTLKAALEKPVVETAKVIEQPLKEEPVKDTAVAIVPPVKKEEVKVEKADVKPEVKTDVVKEEVKKDVIKEAERKDTVTAEAIQPVEPQIAEQKTEPQKTEESSTYYKRSIITKRSESSTTEGFGLVYLDHQDGVVDTIRLLIPHPKKAFVEEGVVKEADTQKLEEPMKTGLQAKLDDEVKKEERTNKPDTDKAAGDQKEERRTFKDITSGLFKSPKAVQAAPAVENSACSSLATDRDFLKVRRNMAAESNDEAMIDEAKVFFRAKCFSTEQIKNLSSLFLTSAAKYQFFDAAYKHVTDPSQFSTLQSEIKDAYYLKRFQALIGQ